MTEKELVVLAKEAMEYAYSPYSKFKVGHLKKTQKRTGLTRPEISAVIAEKMGQWKSSEKYLDHLTSIARFKRKGDIHVVQHENIIKYLNGLLP